MFDVVGSRWWGGFDAKMVADFLRENADAKRIKLRINSPGGDVFEGAAIYNLLRDFDGEVHVQVISLAASMASVIALAGDTVTMAENAMFMIHNPWAFAIGDSEEMLATADLLDKIKDAMLNAYARHSNLSKDEIAALMSAETWMTAQEAKARGFVDRIDPDDDEPTSADDDAMGRARAVLEKFEHVPRAVRGRYIPRLAAMAGQPENKTMTEEERRRLCAALGLPEDAQLETILAVAEAKAPVLETIEGFEMSEGDGSLIASDTDDDSIDLTQWVPRAEFDSLAQRLKKIEADARAEKIDKVIAANKAKIASPTYEAVLRKQLKSGALSFEAFGELMKATPESRLQAEDGEASAEERAVSDLGLEDYEMEFCAEKGIDPAVYADRKKKRIAKRNLRAI